jgi:hypothetical protein
VVYKSEVLLGADLLLEGHFGIFQTKEAVGEFNRSFMQ